MTNADKGYTFCKCHALLLQHIIMTFVLFYRKLLPVVSPHQSNQDSRSFWACLSPDYAYCGAGNIYSLSSGEKNTLNENLCIMKISDSYQNLSISLLTLKQHCTSTLKTIHFKIFQWWEIASKNKTHQQNILHSGKDITSTVVAS